MELRCFNPSVLVQQFVQQYEVGQFSKPKGLQQNWKNDLNTKIRSTQHNSANYKNILQVIQAVKVTWTQNWQAKRGTP